MKNPGTDKDQAYINEVLAIALNHSKDESDSHRPQWHFAPQFGVLNDPNGLAYFNGEYHLFYQWNPKACAHGAKAWGHATSKDLISWQHQPLALAPTEAFESHGCYSGSGLVIDGKLELFYTGNVKFDNGERTAYQCRATLTEDSYVEKKGIILDLPKGYSGHVRDPKVWLHDGAYYMVLGSEDLEKKGKVLLYRSESLNDWESLGEVFGDGINGNQDDSFMLECPDLFPLNEQHVLIFCPKYWIEQDGKPVEVFETAYTIGELDYSAPHFNHNTIFPLDYGFDFYAPQTFCDENGRRLIFGWMGKPDENEPYQPTIEHGWIHQMSCPRELFIKDDHLYQVPAQELRALRSYACNYTGPVDELPVLHTDSAEILISNIAGDDLQLDIGGCLKLKLSQSGLILSRKNWRTNLWEDKEWNGSVSQLQLLVDRSSVEVFINDGEAVMTSRFFSDTAPEIQTSISGTAIIDLTHWQLKAS